MAGRFEEHEMEDLEDLEPVDDRLESDAVASSAHISRAATVRNQRNFNRSTDSRSSLEPSQRRQNSDRPPNKAPPRVKQRHAQAVPAAPQATQNRNGTPATESSVDETDLASPPADTHQAIRIKPHISLCQVLFYGVY